MLAPHLHFLPIHAERILLRIPTLDDSDRMAQYVRDNKAHLGPWEPEHPEEYYTSSFWKELLSLYQQLCKEDRALKLVLVLKDAPDAPVIGTCNFNNIVRGVFQACYLGYGLDYRYQGQGLMYEALTAALKAAFEDLRLHRIMANYMPTNVRSGKLLRKLGFQPEGYARDYLKIAGRWEDHVLTALTRNG